MFRGGVDRVVTQSVRGDGFVRAVFQPIVESMVELAIAVRFGGGTLTDREKTLVNAQLDDIGIASALWTRDNARASAAVQLHETYEAIRKEILL
jgi:hypothetical protein